MHLALVIKDAASYPRPEKSSVYIKTSYESVRSGGKVEKKPLLFYIMPMGSLQTSLFPLVTQILELFIFPPPAILSERTKEKKKRTFSLFFWKDFTLFLFRSVEIGRTQKLC